MYGSKPAFGAVRTHANYTSVKPVAPMGSSLRGPVTNTMQERLLGGVNDLFAQIDEVNALLNQAAQSSVVSSDQHASWLSRTDEVSSGAQRLADRVGTLDDSSLQAWQDELTRLMNLAEALRGEISSTVVTATGSKVLTVAVWTGLGVFGAVGTLLLVRWWAKKPHPRKGHRR